MAFGVWSECLRNRRLACPIPHICRISSDNDLRKLEGRRDGVSVEGTESTPQHKFKAEIWTAPTIGAEVNRLCE